MRSAPFLVLALTLGAAACDRPSPFDPGRPPPVNVEPPVVPLPAPEQRPPAVPAPVPTGEPTGEKAEAPAGEPPSGVVVRSVAGLVERVRGSVVGVTSKSAPRRFPFGRGAGGGEGLGSGVIIEERGIVLTNHHVVAAGSDVTVRTADGDEYPAAVVGADPETDVAVLALLGVQAPLPAAKLGSSDELRVGDGVIAIGNPFGLDFSVTTGIVSAKARVIGAGPYDDFLQTDAAINPGNSGGPLFDLEGNVVGIATAIVQGGQGIGFAVPIDLIEAFLPQLLDRGSVVRGWLGVAAIDLPHAIDGEGGAVISDVMERGPAGAAGLRPGDVVVRVAGRPVKGAGALSRTVALLPPGAPVVLSVVRGGEAVDVEVVLGHRPPEESPRG